MLGLVGGKVQGEKWHKKATRGVADWNAYWRGIGLGCDQRHRLLKWHLYIGRNTIDLVNGSVIGPKAAHINRILACHPAKSNRAAADQCMLRVLVAMLSTAHLLPFYFVHASTP